LVQDPIVPMRALQPTHRKVTVERLSPAALERDKRCGF
jgi:hypothetical protein